MFKLSGMARSALRPGFTLLEVMTVVGVISVLLSLLVTTLSYAKRSAQTAACASNLRQLGLSFINYAQQNGGRSFADVYTAKSYWIATLAPYNTKLGTALNADGSVNKDATNQDLFCPAATTFAGDVGTATKAWGTGAAGGSVYNANVASLTAHSTPASWSFLNAYAGSYGFNAWNYRASFAVGDAMAVTLSANGKCQVIGDTVTTGDTSAPNGAGAITGNVVAGGSASGNINGTVAQNVPGLEVPPVNLIFQQLQATAVTITDVCTIDFTRGPVLYYNGSASLDNVTVVGKPGILLVDGSITGLPGGGQQLSIVARGDITTNGSNGCCFTGALYMTGNFTTNGGKAQISGVVVSMGAITIHGNGTLSCAGDLPGWGGYGYVKNVLTGTPVVTFADAIWPEATPTLGDPLPANTTTGLVSSNMGRFYISRHGSAINAVFSDGHAETVPLTSVPTLKWN